MTDLPKFCGARRTKELLAFCEEPRTMAVIMDHFDDAPWLKAAVQNCVARGKLFNHRKGISRNTHGLYCTKPELPAVERYWGNVKPPSHNSTSNV